MANELSLSFTLQYNKNNVAITKTVGPAANFTISGNGQDSRSDYTATTVDTAIPLGSVSAPYLLYVKNNDVTNFITLKTAVSGTPLAEIKPGLFTFIPLDPSITVPSLQADTASCSVSYCVFDA